MNIDLLCEYNFDTYEAKGIFIAFDLKKNGDLEEYIYYYRHFSEEHALHLFK